MLKLLIADSGEEFRGALTRELAGSFAIRCTGRGRETLEAIDAFRPDLLILDLMLPELDGITLLHQVRERLNYLPICLATTRFTNDYVEEELMKLGVGYIMMKPCDVRAVAARLKGLADRRTPAKPAMPDNRTLVCNILLSMGFKAKLRGYPYLREAILLTLEQPDQMVTKELYPAVARICDANRDRVERSIRSAIDKAFQNRNEDVWRQYFVPDAQGNLARPSNGVFIATIAERIRNAGPGENS